MHVWNGSAYTHSTQTESMNQPSFYLSNVHCMYIRGNQGPYREQANYILEAVRAERSISITEVAFLVFVYAI